MIAGFVACGDAVNSTTNTSRWINNFEGSAGQATGNAAGADAPATGSTVTMSWGINVTVWAVIAVEVLPSPVPPGTYARPGRTWLHYFRCPQFFNQQPPGPVAAQANPATATASGAALNATVVTVSAAAAPQFNPGKTWRKHFQWPQQQQLSGPPPLAWATAGLATATGTANGLKPYPAGLGGTGYNSWFTNQFGAPRLMVIEQAWSLPYNAGRWNSGNWQGDMDAYFAARAVQGYTAWYGVAWGQQHQEPTSLTFGRTWDGVYPLNINGTPGGIVTGAETVTLNDTFWQRIDYLFASARAQGIACFLNMGLSYDHSDTNGIWSHATNAQATAFGAALTARYPQATYPHVFWFFGDDDDGPNDSFYAAQLSGMQGAGDTRALVSIEQFTNTNCHIEFDNKTSFSGSFGAPNATYNWIYSYDAPYFGGEDSYSEGGTFTHIPAVYGDGVYYGDTGAGTIPNRAIRNFAWWALASGSRGFAATSGPSDIGTGPTQLWQWPSDAITRLTTDPNGTFTTSTVGTIASFFSGLTDWWKLIPDTGNVFITAGRGTRGTCDAPGGTFNFRNSSTYVAGSVTPAGTLAVIYCKAAMSITIDQTKLGAGYTATWVDPLSLATQAATPAATYNSTPLGNNSAGDPDWVLVLQGPPVTPAASAGYALPGLTWRKHFQHPQQFVPPAPAGAAATNANAGLASGTATALGQDNDATFDILISPNAGAAVATGASLGQDAGANIAAISPNAATGAGTGTARGFDTGDALPGVSYPPQRAQPSPVWLKFFHHEQQPVPPAPFNVYPAPALATATALGQDTGASIASVAPNAAVAPATGTSLGNDTGANEPAVTVNAGLAAGVAAALDATTSVPGPAQTPAYPGAVWRHYFQHPQQALPPVPAPMVTANAGLASATGTVLGQDTGANIAFVSPNAAVAAATGAAQSPNPSVAPNAGLAAATGAAQNAIANVQPNAAMAPATGTSLGNDTGANEPAVTVNAQTAAAVASALDATTTIPAPPPAVAAPGRIWKHFFQHPQQPVPPAPVIATFVNANAGLASATATALGQDTGANIAFVSPNGGNAPAIGTAPGFDNGIDSAFVSPNAGLASGSGAALGPNPQVTVNAGLAAGTGTAQNVTPSSASAAAATPALPGGTWRKHFQHPQQWRPFVPQPPPALVPATGTSSVSDVNTGVASVSDPRSGLATVGEGASGLASVS
jgi:hypothetical protein